MQLGLTTCIGCRKEYYAGSRQVLLHRDCLGIAAKRVANSDEVVANSVTVVANTIDMVANKASNMVANADSLVANTDSLVANADSLVANKHGQYKDKEKRKEYMKLFMREWRLGNRAKHC